MRPGRLICALCVALLMGVSLGGCCSEDETAAEKPAEQATPTDKKSPEATDKGEANKGEANKGEEYDSKVWEEKLLEEPLRTNPSAEQAEGNLDPGDALKEGQEPGDRLVELEPRNFDPIMTRLGWKLDKPGGEEITGGHRFLASKGDSQVRIDMVKFDTAEEADKVMFKAEENQNTAIGRAHTKLLIVSPGKKEDLSVTREVLNGLMPRKVEKTIVANAPPEADKAEADKAEEGDAPPEGFDPQKPTEQTEPEEVEEEEKAPEGEGEENPEGEEAPEKGEDPAEKGDAP